VSAEPQQGRLGLDESCHAEDDVSVGLVRPALLELWKPSCETLDPDEFGEHEAGRADLVRELLGAVEEPGREPVRPVLRVCVPAIGRSRRTMSRNSGSKQVLTHEAVEQRGESADCRNGDKALGSNDPAGFPESSDAVSLFVQVVEGAEHEHDIEAVIRERQPARITNLGCQAWVAQAAQRLVDMAGCDVEEMHAMAAREQPHGVHSSPSADIEDLRGRCRKVPTNDLLGP
jgi:hypothetical protein